MIPSANPPSAIIVTGAAADAVRWLRLKHAVIVLPAIAWTVIVSELLPSRTASLIPRCTSAHSPVADVTSTVSVVPPDHHGAVAVAVHGAEMPDASTAVLSPIVPAPGSVTRPA